MPELKRQLGLFETTMYGVGLILGAGIYALIGDAAGKAGNSVWISFVIGGIAAVFTGLSYAELSSMYPKAAAEYTYIKNAFRSSFVAFLIGWMTLFVSVIASATIALGFGGYFIQLLQIPIALAAILIISVLTFMNYFGIRESSSMNVVFTIIEASGLAIVIWAGMSISGVQINYLETPNGFAGIFSAFTLVFFAYIGFENIANIAEEIKNPKKILPRAIILAISITAVLYILVSVSAVRVLDWQELGSSLAPLSDVIKTALGQEWSFIISVIALFATTNTVLITLVSGSRILYGVSRDKALPSIFSRIHQKRNTPWVAVSVIGLLSACFVFIGDIDTVANISVFVIIMIFIIVNISVILLRYREPNAERQFRSPINIGKFPVLAALGIITPIFGIIQLNSFVIFTGLIVLALGASFYFTYEKIKKIRMERS